MAKQDQTTTGMWRVRVKYKNRQILLGHTTTERGMRHWAENWWANPRNTTYEEWVKRHETLRAAGHYARWRKAS